MTKRRSTTKRRARGSIYRKNHYCFDDIITKWCIDNRTYPTKFAVEEQPLPVGYNSNSFKSNEEDIE